MILEKHDGFEIGFQKDETEHWTEALGPYLIKLGDRYQLKYHNCGECGHSMVPQLQCGGEEGIFAQSVCDNCKSQIISVCGTPKFIDYMMK